jgi:hypothetical protein
VLFIQDILLEAWPDSRSNYEYFTSKCLNVQGLGSKFNQGAANSENLKAKERKKEREKEEFTVKLICDLLIGQHLSRLNRLHFLKCG